MTLPKTIPIFPLYGGLLLPRGRLPLDIFEPHNIAMVSDALKSHDRLIGMIQPDYTQDDFPEAIYKTGCAGKISEFKEKPDGGYEISLDGLIRFDVIEEIEKKDGYRRVNVSYDRFKNDLEMISPDVDRDSLLKAIKEYSDYIGVAPDWDVLKSCDDEKLVTFLSMEFPFDGEEQQALLEADTLTTRVTTLIMLFKMATGTRFFTRASGADVIH